MYLLCGFVESLQIADPVVNHLDLFLYHRHPFCKAVMLSDFTGQFFHLSFHNGLGDLLVAFTFSCGGHAGNHHTDQRQASGDQRDND